ncbi:hypothetical protein LSTR_LSTR008700 [Laodelphax striatellus]|uniref:Uncharacterized protein n=1 Tax=Laodelphax striatellus TaxID=195883 RepID=A0A482WHK2_LAOST|nr:hypothetical protein LSTR_LSTR008700 [Laodelphax striatellus]
MRSQNVSEDNLSSRFPLSSNSYCGVRRKKGSDVDAKSAEIEKLKIGIRDAQEENLKLQAVISDLTQVNKRWQKYNSDRQMYVQKLLNTIQDQQEQLNKMGEQRAFSSTEGEQDSVSSNRNHEHELARLQETEMILKEKIQVLEFQVKANRDDWEAELNEKKQVLKEKADIEGKVNVLMDELQELKQSILQKQRNERRNICDICRHCMSNELPQPVNSRLFRTAVHLPCSSQNWRGGMSEGACCNLETDGIEKTANNSDFLLATRTSYFGGGGAIKRSNSGAAAAEAEGDYDSGLPRAESVDSNDATDVWNIGERWTRPTNVVTEAAPSYSRASTVPLVSSPVIHVTPSNSNSSVTLIDSVPEAYCVKYISRAPDSPSVCSVVQIPVTKSNSAPENKSWSSCRSSTDSFDPLSDSASCAGSAIVDSPTSSERAPESSSSRQNIICPVCQSAFSPDNNLKFLDHFEVCQRNV